MENVCELSLEDLNDEEAKQYIGRFVLVTVLMVFGIICNLHVLLVYAFKIKPSNHRVFILVLGMLDFIACITGMPAIIINSLKPLTYTTAAICKGQVFVIYYICIASGLVNLVIAADRYRKICVPLGRQLSHRMAKLCCFLVLGVALLVSWPSLVLFGKNTVPTSNPTINGTRCSTEDRFKDTNLLAYFNAILAFGVFSIFVVLVALYGLIGRTISKHGTFARNFKTKHVSELNSANVPDINRFDVNTDSRTQHGGRNEIMRPYSSSALTESSITEESERVIEKKSEANRTKLAAKKMSIRVRTTRMLFLITAIFLLSYIPHLVLQACKFFKKDFLHKLNFTEIVLYNTFLYFPFVNNVALGFITGLCDARFRREIKTFYTRRPRSLRLM